MDAPERIPIEEASFSPRVLESYLFSQWSSYGRGDTLRERYVYDYEFELILESDGAMILDDKTYELSKGDLVFRKPGQYTQAIMRYNCYAFFFDIAGNIREGADYDMHVIKPFQPCYLSPILDSIPTITKTGMTREYLDIFSTILNHHVNPVPGSIIESRALVLSLIKKLYSESTMGANAWGKVAGPHYHALKKVLEYMDNHLDRKISLHELAEIAGLSPNYFHSIFTKAIGVPPNAYMIELKIKSAKELLAGSTHSIAEISELCGFDNIPYFSSLFNKKTGSSPSEFRKKHSPRF